MRILKCVAISALVVIAACSSDTETPSSVEAEPGTTNAATASTTLPGKAPGAPREVSAASVGNGVVRLFWRAPGSSGDYPIVAYAVTPFVGRERQTTKIFGSAATEQSLAGLRNGHEYTFEVAALNAAGSGPFSPRSGKMIVGAPGMPQNVAAERSGPGSVRVSFRVPGDSGAEITSFTAACRSTNGGVTRRQRSDARPIGVTGLSAGKTYRCTVRATNKRGSGRLSDPSNAVAV